MDHMLSLGFSKTLAEWIGSNLKKSGESVVWSFDLDAAIDMFNSYRYNFLLKNIGTERLIEFVPFGNHLLQKSLESP